MPSTPPPIPACEPSCGPSRSGWPTPPGHRSPNPATATSPAPTTRGCWPGRTAPTSPGPRQRRHRRAAANRRRVDPDAPADRTSASTTTSASCGRPLSWPPWPPTTSISRRDSSTPSSSARPGRVSPAVAAQWHRLRGLVSAARGDDPEFAETEMRPASSPSTPSERHGYRARAQEELARWLVAQHRARRRAASHRRRQGHLHRPREPPAGWPGSTPGTPAVSRRRCRNTDRTSLYQESRSPVSQRVSLVLHDTSE